MAEFLAMGGYAQWVWPAYAFTGFVLLCLVFASLRFARNQRAAAERLKQTTAETSP